MPACQYCGRTIGNEGALAQHEASCNRAPETAEAPTTHDAEAPAPATEGGRVVDSIIRVFDDDLPATERTQGARGVLGFVMDGVDRYNEYRQRKLEVQDQRAQNVELEPAVEYPACDECGYQFDGDDIGITDEQVRCAGCGKLYHIRDAEPPIDA